jgi:hypothetical protein
MNEHRGTTHALILYDPATGMIRHTLLETTVTDPPTPDWTAMETKLSALVKQQDPASAGLAMLRSENHNAEHFYKVDVQRRALVEVTPKA